MNKIIYLLIAGTIVAVAAAAISFGGARARNKGEFIQISVLADKHADYGMDGDLFVTAPISIEIVAAKINDDANVQVSTTVIIRPTSSTENDRGPGDQPDPSGNAGVEDGDGQVNGPDNGEDKDDDDHDED